MYKITSKTTKKGQNEHSLEHWDQRSAIIKAPQISMLITTILIHKTSQNHRKTRKSIKIKENHQKSSQNHKKNNKTHKTNKKNTKSI